MDITLYSNECFGEIRVIVRDGDPWFVAKDVCEALDLSNVGMALDRLDQDEKITISLADGNKGGFNTTIVYDEIVCPTLVSSGVIYRFDRKEYFSDQDLINVSSFPQDYDFCGNQAKYVCGMSVPPNMMANIANRIWQQWLMNGNPHD